ncbi:MAG: DUF4836 family protein [Bacteroidales bacterium]|nr:DUF4836 family protein [Bacteroidales bacterium]
MKNLLKIFSVVLIVVVIGLTSCKKQSGNYNFIPSNATVVMVFDGKSISEKSGYTTFAESNAYKLFKEELAQEEAETFKILDPIMNNSNESGLDLKKDIVAFTFKNGENNFVGVHFQLTDKTKVEKLLSDIAASNEEPITIGSENSYSFMVSEDQEAPLLIWNDKQLLMLTVMDGVQNFEVAKTQAMTLFQQSEKESIVSNKDFSDFASNKKDLSFWMDYAVLYDFVPGVQSAMMQSAMPVDMKGVLLQFFIDFQKGKMVLSYKTILNEEMKSYMSDNQIIKDKFDIELLEVMPSQSHANFAIAFDFLAYFNIMKSTLEQNQMNVDMYDQEFKNQTGMTIKEALNEFGGELVINVHKIDMKEVEKVDYMAYYQAGGEGNIEDFKKVVVQPVPYFTVAMEMNNDKLFNILIEKTGNLLVKTGSYYTIQNENMEGYLGLFGKKLVFTNDKNLIDQVTDGAYDGETLAKSEIADNLKKFPAYGFIDLNMDNYPEGLKTTMVDMMGADDFDVFASMMKEYNKLEIKPSSAYEAEMILWLKDDSRNSLEIMLKSVDNNIEAIAN